MPGSSSGTPVVWGDRIFVAAHDRQSNNLLAVCLGRGDGKVIWEQKVGINSKSNDKNDQASPSPITDGKTVWFYYGSGDLAAFDLAGKPLWARSITHDFGQFNMQWIYSASPLLWEGKLYVPVLHRDVPPSGPAGDKRADSYLLCVDPQTGKDLWRVIRPTDAVAESREAYTTPIPVEVDGKTQIVIVGGDCVTGHDATDGHEIWRTPSWNPTKIGHWRTVPSATTGAGLVFACPPKRGKLFAVKPVASGPTQVPLAWENADVTTDVCVPLFYKDQLFVLDGDRKGILSCLDPATGNKKWAVELGSKKVFRGSPTGADDKIYCMNEVGDIWVLSAVDGKLLSTASLGSEAAPAAPASSPATAKSSSAPPITCTPSASRRSDAPGLVNPPSPRRYKLHRANGIPIRFDPNQFDPLRKRFMQTKNAKMLTGAARVAVASAALAAMGLFAGTARARSARPSRSNR